MKPIRLLGDELNLRKLLPQCSPAIQRAERRYGRTGAPMFEENRHGIGLLIADLSIPTGSGIRVALTIRNELPDLPVILTSGFAVAGWSERDTRDLARIGAHTVTSIDAAAPATGAAACR